MTLWHLKRIRPPALPKLIPLDPGGAIKGAVLLLGGITNPLGHLALCW